MHNQQPGIILYDYTRAKASKRAKRMFGADKVDEVIPISRQDAEIEFGDNYMQQARWNMMRSEDMNEVSVLTGDNPFLEEKMNMKKADMGDVIDDFYQSDAPQFQGKSKAKRRQMAIAAKLQANEEEKQHYKLSTVSEGIDQKVLTQFKTMIKDGEEDSVRLLLQGMPKHTKKMYMSRLGIKESDKVDGRTKAFRETINRLNMTKKEVVEAAKHEMTVDGYTTTHFYLCPSALKAMTEHQEVDGAKELTKMQDNYFKFEKKFMTSEPSDADKEKAQSMYESIIDKAEAAGIKEDVDAYMKDHRDSITKGDPKPGFGKVEEDKTMIGIAKALKGSSKGHAKQAKQIMKHVKDMDKVDEDISKMPHSHVKFFATKKIPHGRYTRAEIDDEHRRRQKVEPNYHKVKPSINEAELDELSYKTMNSYYDKAKRSLHRAHNSQGANILRGTDPSKDQNTVSKRAKGIKLAKSRTVDKIRKGQSEDLSAYLRAKDAPKKTTSTVSDYMSLKSALKKKREDLRKRTNETKEAPPGTYFTRSGQLKKGDPASDGKGGAKLASDPLDKQRKTIVNLKNYPK
ncbi:MAG: hypothetical protein CMK23_07470 [Porticoccaceae bacterium]|nr:hypothetical protein [Porticoccaceae bacterium]